MQTGQLCTHCLHDGESAKNIQSELYKKPCVCICVYHKRIKDTFFFGCQKNVNFDWHFSSIHRKFLFRSFRFLEMPLK